MPTRPKPSERREALLAELRRAGGKPLSLAELMQRARLHPGERKEAKRLLRELVRERLVRGVGKRFELPGERAEAPAEGRRGEAQDSGGRPSARGLLGLFTRHRDGFGFVARLDRGGADLYVSPGDTAQAVDGDLVRFEVFPGRRGPQARVVGVMQRGRRMILAAYQGRGAESFAVPLEPELPPAIPVAESRRARDGDVVKVWLDSGPGPLKGTVLERVPDPRAPAAELLRVAYAHGFADVFPEEVTAEADAVPDRVRPEDWEGRRDLTGLRLVTIDGEDARDFDDAVYVERLPGRRGGYRLVVAIADVSHYVRSGHPLDAEALRRGTSVYFAGAVLPMLPERLSNGVCSLNPEVERLCLVADLRIGPEGEPLGTEVYPAVMRSAARCTYGEVARVLEGERVPHREFLRDDFERMGDLQEVLGRMRRKRGAIDFDLPEARVVLGEDGGVLAIERRPRNRAHRVVEEFMLAANEAVARWFGERDLPTIYRVHGLPDEDKLKTFLELAEAQGFEAPSLDAGPAALSDFLDRLAGHPQQRALNQLLLRAMMQAVYSPENIGHFGLAAEQYLHFTSPIRRYPDLVVHRLLREAAPWRGERASRPPREGELERIALLCSERERSAMKAERDVHAFYAALFMLGKVGERSPGTVSAVLEFGLFVELKSWFVEGLVKVEDLGDGFELDADGHALVERRGGRAYRVGDELEVEVGAVDPKRRRIDLLLVEAGKTRSKRPTGLAGKGDLGPAPRGPKPRREGPGKGAAPRGTGRKTEKRSRAPEKGRPRRERNQKRRR